MYYKYYEFQVVRIEYTFFVGSCYLNKTIKLKLIFPKFSSKSFVLCFTVSLVKIVSTKYIIIQDQNHLKFKTINLFFNTY